MAGNNYDPSKSIQRLVLDKLLTLLVVSIPIAGLALWSNGQLAAYNAKLKEHDYQRSTWAKLDEDLTSNYESLLDWTNSFCMDPGIVSNVPDEWVHTPVEVARLQHSLRRIKLYGNNRDEVFLRYCDDALEHLLDFRKVVHLHAKDPETVYVDTSGGNFVLGSTPDGSKAVSHSGESSIDRVTKVLYDIEFCVREISLRITDPDYY